MLWIASAFCLVAVVGSATHAAIQGWRLWRSARTVSSRALADLDRVTASAAAAESRAAGISGGAGRLLEATDRLGRALTELAVLRAAAAEPRALARVVRGAVPRK